MASDQNITEGQPVPVLGTTLPAPQKVEFEDPNKQTNLIVNYIPPEITDEYLKQLFATVGPVQGVKIIRDKASRASLGYAFVNYMDPLHALRAIDTLDGYPLNKKKIKVSYARPSSHTIKNANLYIAHIPKHWDQQALESFFGPYGAIIQSKVLLDPQGQSRGCGFVRFDQNKEAENAIAALHGKVPPGGTAELVVKYASTQSTGGLSSSSQSGSIPTVSGMQSWNQSKSKGSSGSAGGGPMKSSMQLQNMQLRYNPLGALSTSVTGGGFQHTTIPGLMQTVQGTQTWCIFVYNLPAEAEDTTLYQLFSPFGKISSVKVVKEPNSGKSKGYGFVNMMNYDEAFTAVNSLNKSMLDGKLLQVSFKTPRKS
jgi:ELAV/HuD family splicing factor